MTNDPNVPNEKKRPATVTARFDASSGQSSGPESPNENGREGAGSVSSRPRIPESQRPRSNGTDRGIPPRPTTKEGPKRPLPVTEGARLNGVSGAAAASPQPQGPDAEGPDAALSGTPNDEAIPNMRVVEMGFRPEFLYLVSPNDIKTKFGGVVVPERRPGVRDPDAPAIPQDMSIPQLRAELLPVMGLSEMDARARLQRAERATEEANLPSPLEETEPTPTLGTAPINPPANLTTLPLGQTLAEGTAASLGVATPPTTPRATLATMPIGSGTGPADATLGTVRLAPANGVLRQSAKGLLPSIEEPTDAELFDEAPANAPSNPSLTAPLEPRTSRSKADPAVAQCIENIRSSALASSHHHPQPSQSMGHPLKSPTDLTFRWLLAIGAFVVVACLVAAFVRAVFSSPPQPVARIAPASPAPEASESSSISSAKAAPTAPAPSGARSAEPPRIEGTERPMGTGEPAPRNSPRRGETPSNVRAPQTGPGILSRPDSRARPVHSQDPTSSGSPPGTRRGSKPAASDRQKDESYDEIFNRSR